MVPRIIVDISVPEYNYVFRDFFYLYGDESKFELARNLDDRLQSQNVPLALLVIVGIYDKTDVLIYDLYVSLISVIIGEIGERRKGL